MGELEDFALDKFSTGAFLAGELDTIPASAKGAKDGAPISMVGLKGGHPPKR
jgi:hypothetical protein